MNNAEIERLSINQPFLKYNKKENKISGKLLISMYYNSTTKKAILYNVSQYLDKKETIIDQYEIEINLFGEMNIPEIKETKGRLKTISEKLGIPLNNLHVSVDGTCCLMPISQAYFNSLHNKGIIYYFENEIYPYFYSQSYFERFGIRPFGEFSHGWQGNIEYFNMLPFEIKNEVIESITYAMKKGILYKIISNNYLINGTTPCLCGCGNTFTECNQLTTKDKFLIIELFSYLKKIKENYPYVLHRLKEYIDKVLKGGLPSIGDF